MIITGRTQMLSDLYSIDETIDIFKGAGFDGIEFGMADKNFHIRPDYLEDYLIAHVREKADRSGMVISAVANHMEYTYNDDIFAFLKKSIPKIPLYGTNILITSSMSSMPTAGMAFMVNRKTSDPDYWKKYTARLRELLKIAADSNVIIAIEPEPPNFITSTDDFLRLCDEMNMPNLGCNFDVGHAFLTDLDVNESARKLGGRIVHMHVENMYRGEHMHQYPANGDMDLKSLFKAVKSTGFNGAMALDIYVYDYIQAAPVCVKQLRDILKEV